MRIFYICKLCRNLSIDVLNKQLKKQGAIQMILIRCVKCKNKLFKYHKVGKGKVIHCWDDRILKDYSINRDGAIFCKCGNQVGQKVTKGIRMKQNAFTWSGTISNK